MKGSAATKSQGNIIYKVCFLCKDVSTTFNNNFYRIHLYTHEGLGNNFFGGFAADNFYKNAEGKKKMENYAQILTKFNSYVDAVVERRSGLYFIKDTKMIF